MITFDLFVWVFIPTLIFLARTIDVSLATMRHILVFKGYRKLVPALAFVEAMILLLAITQTMQNLDNAAAFLAFAGGFSAGTYAGMVLEEKLALGYQLVRVIAPGETEGLTELVREKAAGHTSVKAAGNTGPVSIFLIVSERKRLKSLVEALNTLKPKPFYTVEDVRSVGSSFFNPRSHSGPIVMEGAMNEK